MVLQEYILRQDICLHANTNDTYLHVYANTNPQIVIRPTTSKVKNLADYNGCPTYCENIQHHNHELYTSL